ncbi:MAG: transporter substrate-binding domain-containing protein [Pontiellaceae bacterium]|nr:transporter substrate-binding domain-containing protein [Pontiellaceae bacterium]
MSAATDNFPYSYLDEDGKLTGYGVDMLDAVAEVMNVRLERTLVPAREDIANLASGEFDIYQFHAPLAEGSTVVAFSQPILVNMGDIFIRNGDKRYASIDDLLKKSARVAAAQGGQEYLLARGFDPANIALSTSTEAILALSKGEVDAVLLTRLTGLTQAYHNGVKNIRPLGLTMSDLNVTYSIATRIDDTALLQQINEALAFLSTTGKTVEIYTRWFGRYESKGPSLAQILAPAAIVLALALVVTLLMLRRQHLLRRRISAQAEELRLSRGILAEAQRFAHLGHFQYPFAQDSPAVWSQETFHIFGFNPTGTVPAPEQMVALAIPGDQERWRDALAVDGGGAPYEFDISINTLSGQRKILNVRGHPTVDASGVPDGTFGTVQDVTASRAASAALKQSELLLRALYENLPMALSVLEYQQNAWCILSVNPEAARQFNSGVTPDERTPITELGLPPELTRFWCDQFDHAVRYGETLQFEYESDRSLKHYSSAVVPLVLPEQSPRCCFLSEDITARKLKDEELSQSRRLRAVGELVGGIAHEFNNLITPITLNAEILLGQCDETSKLRHDLELILDAGRRAGELTRRLLTFGRRNDRQAGTVDLSAIVNTNIALVRHTFDRRITITSSVPDDLPKLILPGNDLQQIILNLLLNARDTLTEKLERLPSPDWIAQIDISVSVNPSNVADRTDIVLPDDVKQWVRLTVRDNGCGIPPEVRERIFEPFFTTKAVGKGSGLGLATIWHLVTELGGRVEVESVPNEGSAFHLDLPIYSKTAVDEPSTRATADEPLVSASPTTLHFLLAEDEPSVALVVRRLIERMGHQVTIAGDGLMAIETLSEAPENYDAVLMDLNMPKLTGAEVAVRARALPYDRPIIVMSGRIGEEDLEALLSCGVTEMLNKPFSRAEFEAVLARLFGGK